jgi:phosphate transport system protein
MSEKHLSSQFDTDLTTISTKVLQMGGLVEAQIARAMRALANFDTAMCDQVLAVEQEINALEIEIDGDCNNIIARRQPTARDLRLVMAISKTITNLERAGDEAAKIAKRTKRLMQDPSAHALNYAGVDRSGEMAATILRHALRGFMRELITYMMENPRTISVALDLLFIAKAIERIGDHAKNIAEFIIYIVKGTDVRHAGREALEREILGEGE